MMPQTDTIIVKLRDGKDSEARSRRIRKLFGNDFIRDAHPLFPGEEEEGLASLYEVVLKSNASVEQALAYLNKVREVEYAHIPQDRKPL
jgi:hypothetical protein